MEKYRRDCTEAVRPAVVLTMDERSIIARALFGFFDQNRIAYCVVGDTRTFLEAIPSDIDIVVYPDLFDELPRILSRFCHEYDLRLVQLIQHEQTAIYFVLAWIGESGRPQFLAPDFCTDYFRGGRRLLSAEEILTRRVLVVDEQGVSRGFYAPPPDVQFIYYLLKKIDKGDLSEVHGEYLSARWHDDPDQAWSQMRRYWPAPEEAELLARAAETNQWAAVRRAAPALRKALHRSIAWSFAAMAGELARRARRMLHPTGLVVVFLGPDGCGKSSVIDQALSELSPVFRHTRYVHLRPRIAFGTNVTALPVTNPYVRPPRGRVASVAKLFYFLLDYVAGYAFRVWPLAVRSTLVAFDRYYHDLLVDPRRYRYGGPMGLARFVGALIPHPDLWMLLDAPAEILQVRKHEVSAAESERQRLGYQRFARRFRHNCEVVDAARPLAIVVGEVEVAILRFLEQRVENRYPRIRLRENPVTARLLLLFCRRKIPVLSKLFRIVFNSDIYCRIRTPILMPHPYGIVIHSQARIGSRVTIMQQVTIGGKDPGENVAPVIEDDVYIGAGAKVLGNVRVGRGAVIGANAVITRDVPSYCTVVSANRILSGQSNLSGSEAMGLIAEQRPESRDVSNH